MASLKVGGAHEAIRKSVAGGLTQMVRSSNIRRFKKAVVKPHELDVHAKRWALSTTIPWLDIAEYPKTLQYPHPVFDYSRTKPEFERNINGEFNTKNAYGDLMQYCQEQFSRSGTEGVRIEDPINGSLLLSKGIGLIFVDDVLFSINELQKKHVIIIERPNVSMNEIWNKFHATLYTADSFALTQLLMSRLEVKSGELCASSGPRGGYTEIGIEFHQSNPSIPFSPLS